MLPKIPSEGSYASWLVDCIRRYFEALGFTFYSEIQSQQFEDDYPFDIYTEIRKGNFVKRFGLQVKRPYITGKGIFWKLAPKQHAKMSDFQWIYYSLPDFLNRSHHRVACHHVIFRDPNFPFVSRLYKSQVGFYYRFGSFANGIMNCPIGQKVDQTFDWIKSEDMFEEFPFTNQFHTYLDLTEKKGQIVKNIEVQEKTE